MLSTISTSLRTVVKSSSIGRVENPTSSCLAFVIGDSEPETRACGRYTRSFIIAAIFGHLGVDCSFFAVVCRKKNTAG